VVAECGWLVRLLDTWIDIPELKFLDSRKRLVIVVCLKYEFCTFDALFLEIKRGNLFSKKIVVCLEYEFCFSRHAFDFSSSSIEFWLHVRVRSDLKFRLNCPVE